MSAWEDRRLLGVAEVILGRQRSPQNAAGPHMVPYLRAANVQPGRIDLTDVKAMNFTPREQGTFKLLPGDVLVTEGSGSIASVGASARWEGPADTVMCFQNTLLRLRARPRTDPRWLAWWAQHAFVSGLFAAVAGGANIYHLSADRVRSLPVALPPLDEQRRVADFLDTEIALLDELSQLRGTQAGLLVDRWRARIDGVFSSLSQEHQMMRLSFFIEKIEQGTSPQCDNTPADEGTWGVVKAGAVKKGKFLPEENKRLPDEIAPEHRYEIQVGDLLITRANTPTLVGAAAVVPPGTRRKLILCDKIFRLRLRAGLSTEYVALMAQSSAIRDMRSSSATGASSSMVNLTNDNIKAWSLPVPPMEIQHAVVRELSDLQKQQDDLAGLLGAQQQGFAERRRALITSAVTGKLDVPTARGGAR